MLAGAGPRSARLTPFTAPDRFRQPRESHASTIGRSHHPPGAPIVGIIGKLIGGLGLAREVRLASRQFVEGRYFLCCGGY